MNFTLKSALAATTLVFSAQAAAEVIFYERENFEGRSFTAQQPVRDLSRAGFNDRASSAVVLSDRWEACEDVRFGGRCIILRPGRYPSLAAMGLNNQISSLRTLERTARVDDSRYAPPPPAPVYDSRRRRDERLFEAPVTSVRAIAGTPQQRCWMEKEQVPQESRNLNVPGAVVGAVLGGILGHQIGSGRGNDVATVGGAVAGGAVGSQVGRNRNAEIATRDVQRCENVSSQAKPEFWDVTYTFRGQEHKVQMTQPPGSTITVNRNGEPRT
jgi:uncharacterized protein YcfJ